jgi:hypothetical protein
VPCVCSRVQSPLPSVRPSVVCGLCGLSARQSLRGCSVRTTARGCWCVYVQCLHQYFAVTRHSWSSLSNVVVFLFCFLFFSVPFSPSMSSPCAVLCQCCCRPPRSPSPSAQLRGFVVPSWPSTVSLLRGAHRCARRRVCVRCRCRCGVVGSGCGHSSP